MRNQIIQDKNLSKQSNELRRPGSTREERNTDRTLEVMELGQRGPR